MDKVGLAELLALYEAGRLDEAVERCREVLDRDPSQLEATYLLGRIHLDRSDAATAITLLRKAVQLAPDWPEVHANLGAALFLRNRLEEAAYHIRRAAALDPRDPEARNNLGVALLADGRANEAEEAFRCALALRPDYAEALYNLGVTLSALGRCSEARERFEQALRLDPNNPDIHVVLGNVLLRLSEHGAAESEFRCALDTAPRSTEAAAGLNAAVEARERAGSATRCVVMGAQRLESGENEAAEAAFRQALSISPDDSNASRGLATVLLRTRRSGEARPILERLLIDSGSNVEMINSYGAALRDLGEGERAAAQFRRALGIDPENRNATVNLANTLTDLGRAEEAVPLCRRGVSLWPGFAEMRNALGVALDQRNDEGAEAAFEQAVRLAPDYAVALMNLGDYRCRHGAMFKAVRPLKRALAIDPNLPNALDRLAKVSLAAGRRATAEELLRRAIALSPSPDTHLYLGACLLAREQYEEGWVGYERRLETPGLANRGLNASRWQGDANPNGTLLVCAEQGFGDNFQFARYLALAKERWQGSVVYYCYPELVELFEASGLPAAIRRWPHDAPFPRERHDAFISLASLPGLFGTITETIPADVPYLRAPADRVATWRERIDRGPELTVGLLWGGKRATEGEALRSCDLSDLAPLSGISGVRYFSLQAGPDARQLQEPPDGLEIVNLGGPDFTDTAAIMHHLDLVISIDTSVAHLGGALGRPTWVVLPFGSDWRWLIDREDSPWYPTARLFRQTRYKAWEPVWTRVANELRNFADARSTGARGRG